MILQKKIVMKEDGKGSLILTKGTKTEEVPCEKLSSSPRDMEESDPLLKTIHFPLEQTKSSMPKASTDGVGGKFPEPTHTTTPPAYHSDSEDEDPMMKSGYFGNIIED